nr:MAG TPA: hypothetical protein [Caudoviricetes sp.]
MMKQYEINVSVKYNGHNIFKQLTYEELVKVIEETCYRMTRFDVIGYLISYNGVVTEEDYNNINKAWEEDRILK